MRSQSTVFGLCRSRPLHLVIYLWLIAVTLACVLGGTPRSVHAISGAHPWIVVLCKFTDLTGEPEPPSYYRAEYGGASGSAVDFTHYWHDVSYGQLDVSGTSVVSHWYSLGMTRFEWDGLNRYDKVRTCADTASGDIDYSKYYGVIALFNDDSPGRLSSTTLATAIGDSDATIHVASTGGFPAPPFAVIIGSGDNAEKLHVTATSGTSWTVSRAYEGFNNNHKGPHAAGETIGLIDGGDLGAAATGQAGFTLGGKGYSLGAVVAPWTFNMTGSAHETGHGLGYHHSRELSNYTNPNSTDVDYHDCFDVMSAYSVCSFAGDFGGSNINSIVGAAGPGITAMYLKQQGWLADPGPRVFQLDTSSCNQTTLGFAGLNYSNVSGYLAAKIPAKVSFARGTNPTVTSDYYWLEYRDKSGWDRGIPASSIVLHLHGDDDYAYLADVIAGKRVGNGGWLLPSQEWVDTANKTYIAVNSIDSVNHQARVTVGGCQLQADLSYSGDTTGQYNHTVNLAGDLTAHGSGAPIPQATLMFTLGNESCQATTDDSGHASCPVALTQQPGSAGSVSVSYAGDDAYKGTRASQAFTITKEATAVAYSGDVTAPYHHQATASAVLTDRDTGDAISGETVRFQLGASDTCSAVTDDSGTATCTIVPTQAAGSYQLTASFAENAFRLGSSTQASFAISKEATALTYTGDTHIANGTPANMSAVLEEDLGTPIANRMVTFSLGTGSSAQQCSVSTDATGSAACTIVPAQPLNDAATVPMLATFTTDAFYQGSSARADLPLEYFTGRAYGISANVNLPLASIFIPAEPDTGDIRTASAGTTAPPCSASLDAILVTADAICAQVTTQLDPGVEIATASVGHATIGIPGLPVIEVQNLQATSQSTCRSATATTNLTLTIGGVPTSVSLAPNSVIDLGVAKLIVNEQLPVPGSDAGLTVNALHLVVPGGGDVILGSATSAVHNCG